jgi:hypothetical protein
MSDGFDGGHDGGHDGFGHDGFGLGHDGYDHGDLDYGDGYSHTDHGGHITSEALMLSHSHAHDGDWGHSFGHMSMDGYNDFHTSLEYGDMNGPSVPSRLRLEHIEQAKNDPYRKYFGAHLVGHGYANAAEIFTRLAKENRCLGVGGRAANFRNVDTIPMELTDWDNFNAPFNRKKTPAGWYPGANGMTKIWQQYWQVGKRKKWWNIFDKDYVWDRTKSTYLQVSIITWVYSDVGDFETRIDIQVKTVPVLDQSDKQWGFRKTPFLEHQKAAKTIVEAMFKEIMAIKPTQRMLDRRKKMLEDAKSKKQKEEEAAKLRKHSHFSYGNSGADLDTLIDPITEAEALKETAATVPPVKMATVEVSIPAPN